MTPQGYFLKYWVHHLLHNVSNLTFFSHVQDCIGFQFLFDAIFLWHICSIVLTSQRFFQLNSLWPIIIICSYGGDGGSARFWCLHLQIHQLVPQFDYLLGDVIQLTHCLQLLCARFTCFFHVLIGMQVCLVGLEKYVLLLQDFVFHLFGEEFILKISQMLLCGLKFLSHFLHCVI